MLFPHPNPEEQLKATKIIVRLKRKKGEGE